MEPSQWSEKATGFCLINILFREFRVRGFISLEFWDISSKTPQLHFHQISLQYYEKYIDIKLNDMQ